MSGCDFQHVTDNVDPLLASFAAAFRKAFAMDFYITKYQGKMMQSLTPLFQTMTEGLHRLAAEEKWLALAAGEWPLPLGHAKTACT